MGKPGARVFVTGVTGFVGSYCLRKLLEDPARKVAVLIRDASDVWRIEDRLDRATIIRGDLTDVAAFEAPLAAFAPDTVVHLAWFGVGPKDRNHRAQLKNIDHSIELLKLAHRVGAKHWVGLGSQAEYGPRTRAIAENDPTVPTTLYGAAKLSVCHLSRLLCAELEMRYVWLRVFSTYGPGDEDRWLIPYVILALLRGERPVLTAAQQQWDYLHVDDIAEAVKALITNTDAEGVFNVGAGRVVSIRRVVERIRDLIDPSLPVGFGELLYRPDQVMHLEADITSIEKVTGWHPAISLSEGLAQTVEWYRENQHQPRYNR